MDLDGRVKTTLIVYRVWESWLAHDRVCYFLLFWPMVDLSQGSLTLFEGFMWYQLRLHLMRQPLGKFNKVCIMASI